MAATPTTVHDLVELLRKSGIYTSEEIEQKLTAAGDLPDDPVQAASTLVQKGVISKFQAKLLLGGRYKGFKLGPYIIREQLGAGGMGAVFLAEHETLKRKVAVKVLTPPKDDPNQKLTVERFIREARAAAALDHPNIVRLHDIGKQGDTNYLVMEHVDGVTLERMIEKNGTVTAARAVEYIAQAAAGLQHAHERGFIHRDIKPGNLIVAKDGTVKILDMGLARSMEASNDKLTEVMDAGAIVGTADFISPEQAMNAPNIDTRSDIYSLGATFYALVVGQPPFAGNTTQKLIQHQLKEAPSLTSLDKTFPPELSAVVARMLAKKPENRYATPADVIKAVAAFLPELGATRVVAGLTGTDLNGSIEMQNTLNEIGGGTKRFGSSARLALEEAVAPKPRLSSTAIFGIALAVASVVVGYLIYNGYYSDDPGPSPTTPPTDGKKAETKTQPAVASKVPTPKATALVALVRDPEFDALPLIYRMDLSASKPFTETGRTDKASQWIRTERTGDGTLPENWRFASWNRDAAVVAMALSPVEGRPCFGFRTVSSTNNVAGAYLSEPEFASPTRRVRLRLEYKVEKEGAGMMIRFKPMKPAVKNVWELPAPPSAVGWNLYDKEVDLRGSTGGFFEFHSKAVSGDQWVWLRSVEVRELPAADGSVPATATTPLFRLDLAGQKTMTERIGVIPDLQDVTRRKGRTLSKLGDGNLPAGWYARPINLDDEGEVELQPDPDGLVVALRTGPAKQAVRTMMLFAPAATVPAGGCHLAIVYRTVGPANECSIRFRQAKPIPLNPYTVVRLPATNGDWRTVEAPFPTTEITNGTFEIHNNTRANSNGGELVVRSFALYAGSPPPTSPPLVTVSFATIKPAKVRLEEQTMSKAFRTLDGQTLPAGSFVNQYKAGCSGEMAVSEIDGTNCLGLRMITGDSGLQYHTDCSGALAGLASGAAARVRITYQNTGTNPSNAYIQLGLAPYTGFANAAMPPATGWQTADLTFIRPPTGEKFECVIQAAKPNAMGEGMLWVKGIEIFPVAVDMK